MFFFQKLSKNICSYFIQVIVSSKFCKYFSVSLMSRQNDCIVSFIFQIFLLWTCLSFLPNYWFLKKFSAKLHWNTFNSLKNFANFFPYFRQSFSVSSLKFLENIYKIFQNFDRNFFHKICRICTKSPKFFTCNLTPIWCTRVC